MKKTMKNRQSNIWNIHGMYYGYTLYNGVLLLCKWILHASPGEGNKSKCDITG